MIVTRGGRRFVALLGILSSVVLLSACSEGGRSTEQPRNSAAAGSTAGSAGSWQQTDTCTLLSDEDVRTHLRGEAVRPKPDNQRADRPTCVWEGQATHKVRVVLWQPPIPSVQTDTAERVIDVAGKRGYVSVETDLHCTMDVDAGPAWIQLDTSAPLPESGDTEAAECDRAAGLGKKALTQLGW
ncbi:MAG: DUF3558 domain-containing protein [Pseudonocardiaceae bacterium]|nr:DUF3558 domain-containing protein [Pseudonocardiaceae bacterium]